MFLRTILCVGLAMAGTTAAYAADLKNPSFEDKFSGWVEAGDKEDSKTSDVARTGKKSAKMTSKKARFDQVVKVDANSTYVLQAYFAGPGVIGVDVGGKTHSEKGKGTDKKKWYPVQVTFETGSATSVSIWGGYTSAEVRYDDFSLTKK